MDMNALRAKAQKMKAEKKEEFIPIDLNEGNVQAIFNRCVSKDYSTDCLYSDIFSTSLGYPIESTVFFNKNIILQNKHSIQYLFGQLSGVHKDKKSLNIDEFFLKYGDRQWTSNKAVLMNLLYLGGCNEINCIFPFSKKDGDLSTISLSIKPTLSPKDPNFPAWWEEHKAEWEEPKKEGQEPADD